MSDADSGASKTARGYAREVLGEATRDLLAAARLLSAVAASSDPDSRRENAAEIRSLCAASDARCQGMLFPREGRGGGAATSAPVYSLATALQGVFATIAKAAHFLASLEPAARPDGLRRFCEIVEAMAVEIAFLYERIWTPSASSWIERSMQRISQLELEAGDLYAAEIQGLLRGGAPLTVEVSAWHEIYRRLDEVCDRCREVTVVVRGYLPWTG